MQHVNDMPKVPLQYDPSGKILCELWTHWVLVARQNPQAPPAILPQIQIDESEQLNNQMANQMTAYQHREQRRVKSFLRKISDFRF